MENGLRYLLILGGYGCIGDGYYLWLHKLKVNTLIDYKFYCFSGKVKYLYISKGLEDYSTASISFVTPDWKFAPFYRNDYMSFTKLPEKPKYFNEMIQIAEKLSEKKLLCE